MGIERGEEDAARQLPQEDPAVERTSDEVDAVGARRNRRETHGRDQASDGRFLQDGDDDGEKRSALDLRRDLREDRMGRLARVKFHALRSALPSLPPSPSKEFATPFAAGTKLIVLADVMCSSDCFPLWALAVVEVVVAGGGGDFNERIN